VSHLVSVTEIQIAADRLRGVALHTPLVPFAGVDPPLLIKAESLQPTGAFKLRGAYTAISALSPEQRGRGVVAHSSGNHAHAVAYAAALLGVSATVVVPTNAPEVKVRAARSQGAHIVTCDPGLANRMAVVAELVAMHGYTEIPPFEHRAVIAGQGTVGREIAADCPDVDLVVCPVGGGGLIAGVAAAVTAACPKARVVGIEPELAADARDSLSQGHRVAWSPEQTQRTIADALRVDQVGELPMQHLHAQVHDIITVTDDEIRAAMRLLATGARLVAEPGGAVAVAACLFRSSELPSATKRVAILSGGNVDPVLLAGLLGAAGEPRPQQGVSGARRPESAQTAAAGQGAVGSG
jgi:threo-3-hydroxy-L-aspartate ammonia-lyase